MQRWRGRGSLVALILSGAVLAMEGRVLAENVWVYELANSVAFYQTRFPHVDWAPYVQTLERAKNGLDRGDEQIVALAVQEFAAMLRGRSFGMDAVTASELYALLMALNPIEPAFLTTGIAAEGSERLMRVPSPGTVPRTPRCHEAGCDEWIEAG